MRQLNSLDKVIREVDDKTKVSLPDQKIVIIDKKKWQAVPRKRLFGMFGGDLAFYLVSNTNDPSNIAERQARPYNLTNFATGQKLGISIVYWLSCEPGNEEKLALALCRGKTLGEALDQKVEKWIADYTKNDASIFLQNYSIELAKLQEHIKRNIKEEVGANLEIKLSLEKESQLQPFKISSFPLEVYVADCDDPLELQVQTELIVDEDNKVKAIFNNLNDAQKWQELVKIFKLEIKKYLLQNIKIDQFSYELKDTVRNQLVEHLNAILISYGRQIGYLSLSSDAVASAKQLVPIKCAIDCEVQKYSNPISVENTILMLPLRTAIYKPNQLSKLQDWVESKLEKIIKPLLLQKKYVEVLLNFEPVSKEIKRQMQSEAKLIGYEVQQIVSVPYLEHEELKENFEVSIREQSFATKDVNVKVQLGVSVTAKINNFAKIEDYLKPKANIKELIEKAIHLTTSQFLATIEPERYYMRFYHPGVDERGQPEKQSVEQELKTAVKQALEDRFNAEVSIIAADVYDTEITKHFKELYGKIGEFEVEVASLTDIEEAVTYQGEFQIQGVDVNSWYTFQARKPEINQISQSIQKSLSRKLSTFSKNELQYSDLEYLSLLEGLIEQWAREIVIKQFGLEISIDNLSRSRTKQEQLLAQEKEDKLQAYRDLRATQLEGQQQMALTTTEYKLAELNALRKKRLSIIANEDNEDEIEELDEKIRVLEKEVSTPSMEDAVSHSLSPQKSRQSPSLREIAEKAKLKSVNNAGTLNSVNDSDIPKLDNQDSE